MSQQKFNNFIIEQVLSSGYNLEFNTLTPELIYNLRKLLDECAKNQSSYSDANHNYRKIKRLYEEMKHLVDLVAIYEGYHDIWDEFWELSKAVSNIEYIDWSDPDATYREDILARLLAVENWLSDNKENYHV